MPVNQSKTGFTELPNLVQTSQLHMCFIVLFLR